MLSVNFKLIFGGCSVINRATNEISQNQIALNNNGVWKLSQSWGGISRNAVLELSLDTLWRLKTHR